MDEDQYRSAYREMNPTRCYFEKLLLLRYGQCEQAEKLLLAEREAFACKDAVAQQQCRRLLDNLRANARFALQITQANGPLPHAKEIKVQVGGIYGLQQLLADENLADTTILSDEDARFGEQAQERAPIENVHGTINKTVTKYQSLDKIPYNEVVKSIINFKLPERKRRSKRKRSDK